MGKVNAHVRGSGETLKHTSLAEKASVGHQEQSKGQGIGLKGKHGYQTDGNKMRASGQIGGGVAHRVGSDSRHVSNPLSFKSGSGKSNLK